MTTKQSTAFLNRAAMVAALGVLATATAPAKAGQQGDAVTISWSGATFMRPFTTSRGITLLTPGTSITLNAGPGGAPITFTAPSGAATSVQLAATDLAAPLTSYSVAGPNNAAIANYYGVRFEWHEQGSIEGVSEMINDQIGALSSVVPVNRNASVGNPTWINSNSFGTGAFTVPLPPTYSTATQKGHNLSTSDYNPAFGASFDDSNPARPGRNVQGGQNRVQLAVSDVNARQGFNVPGTPAYNRIPGAPGYGKGNPSLPLGSNGLQGIGNAGVRHEFNSSDVINMPTTKADPTTGANYSAGPWNNGGLDNLDNKIVAVGGMAYVANPGTGLERLNRSDNVWLHTTGRLANGADFNAVSRDAYSGTINAATNTLGLDTTWAVGENDSGNTGTDNPNALAETRVGGMKFSGKTSGSSAVRPTVQNGRMTVGHLSSSDAIPAGKQSNSRPIRVLMYRDDADDFANGSNNTMPAALRNNRTFADPIAGTDASKDVYNGFTQLTAKSIVEGSYQASTNQTYITVKAPNAAYAGDTAAQWAARTDAQTGIKGDNSGNDVFDMRQNITGAVASFPATSVANPADQLLQLSFMLPQFVKRTRDLDGLNRDDANPLYNSTLSSAFLGSTYAANFNADPPQTVTTGTNSNYGNNNVGNGAAAPAGGSIRINNGNWLFGDFDQRPTNQGAGISGKGFRDLSDLAVATQAQAALAASGAGTDWNAGSASTTTISGLPSALNTGVGHWGAGAGTVPTKGDLIVLGDYDSNGAFDGKDLFHMAHGTSLATTASGSTLGADGLPFADAVRRGVLRKNAALDWLRANATEQQKKEAGFKYGALNAFVKEDVNHDGLVTLKDARLVDHYLGQRYTNLDQQLAAVQSVDRDAPSSATAYAGRIPFNLVDAELNDSNDGLIDTTDFAIMLNKLSHGVPASDVDLDGQTTFDDFAQADFFFGAQGNISNFASKWSTGDTNLDGFTDVADYLLIDESFISSLSEEQRSTLGTMNSTRHLSSALDIYNYHASLFGAEYTNAYAALVASVPEPTTVSIALAGLALAMKRRRRRC